MFLNLKTRFLKENLKLNINVSFVSFISSETKEMKEICFTSIGES